MKEILFSAYLNHRKTPSALGIEANSLNNWYYNVQKSNQNRIRWLGLSKYSTIKNL